MKRKFKKKTYFQSNLYFVLCAFWKVNTAPFMLLQKQQIRKNQFPLIMFALSYFCAFFNGKQTMAEFIEATSNISTQIYVSACGVYVLKYFEMNVK